MNLLERFLSGDISIICRTKDDFEKMKLFFHEEENICVISAASSRYSKSTGAEFAFPEAKWRAAGTEDLIHYNPVHSPLSQYEDYKYTETMEFPEFWDGLNHRTEASSFDAGLFYAMLGMDIQEV